MSDGSHHAKRRMTFPGTNRHSDSGLIARMSRQSSRLRNRDGDEPSTDQEAQSQQSQGAIQNVAQRSGSKDQEAPAPSPPVLSEECHHLRCPPTEPADLSMQFQPTEEEEKIRCPTIMGIHELESSQRNDAHIHINTNGRSMELAETWLGDILYDEPWFSQASIAEDVERHAQEDFSCWPGIPGGFTDDSSWEKAKLPPILEAENIEAAVRGSPPSVGVRKFQDEDLRLASITPFSNGTEERGPNAINEIVKQAALAELVTKMAPTGSPLSATLDFEELVRRFADVQRRLQARNKDSWRALLEHCHVKSSGEDWDPHDDCGGYENDLVEELRPAFPGDKRELPWCNSETQKVVCSSLLKGLGIEKMAEEVWNMYQAVQCQHLDLSDLGEPGDTMFRDIDLQEQGLLQHGASQSRSPRTQRNPDPEDQYRPYRLLLGGAPQQATKEASQHSLPWLLLRLWAKAATTKMSRTWAAALRGCYLQTIFR